MRDDENNDAMTMIGNEGIVGTIEKWCNTRNMLGHIMGGN
jgi:hypothetical protein